MTYIQQWMKILHLEGRENNNNNTLYLKRVARNSYKTSKLVAHNLKLQQK